MKRIAVIAVGLMCLGAVSSFAADTTSSPLKATLAAVPAAELPTKAAQLIQAAKAADREATTINVVKAAVALNPAAAPATVGAIARAVPDMAALAASVAAAEQPKMAAALAKAAAAAAPKQAGQIVTAVIRVVPSDYKAIAMAVAQAVPNSNKDILSAVGTALPDLKPSIERYLSTYTSSSATAVAVVLNSAQVASTSDATATPTTSGKPLPFGDRAPRGPAIGPPYIPLTTTPANTDPSSSGDVPPGGRNYAAP